MNKQFLDLKRLPQTNVGHRILSSEKDFQLTNSKIQEKRTPKESPKQQIANVAGSVRL